jgi:hypothetical protein
MYEPPVLTDDESLKVASVCDRITWSAQRPDAKQVERPVSGEPFPQSLQWRYGSRKRRGEAIEDEPESDGYDSDDVDTNDPDRNYAATSDAEDAHAKTTSSLPASKRSKRGDDDSE